MMRRRIFLGVGVAAVIGACVYWALTGPWISLADTVTLPAYTPDLANGLVAFNAGGCASCHAVPDQPDRLKLGGGLAIPSPFGTFYAPNISPDKTDGIGNWTEANFVTAVTKGVSPRGTHYFPAFPYTSYAHARVVDIRDIYAYLKTLAPVSGKVREHDLPFPFNIRRNVGIWKLLFFDDRPFAPDLSHSPPISSTASAIAPSVIPRAISSAASLLRSDLPVARILKARAGCPTSPKKESASGAIKTSLIFSSPGKRPTAIPQAARWCA
jgi:mono/diheme cytochrome c family protein